MVVGRRSFLGIDTLFRTVLLSLLALLVIIMVYPFVVTVSTSISDNRELVAKGTVYLLPRGFSLSAYALLAQTRNIPRYYLNTVVYAVSGTLLMLLISSLTAYPLSVKHFSGKRFITVMMTVTLFIGGGLIPYFVWVKSMGFFDNIWAIIVPGALNVWNIIIFKTFFAQLPKDLTDSAYIDGANDVQILSKIIVPLSKPILATFAVYGLVGIWNDFFTALIFLNNPDLQPMQLYLRGVLIGMDNALFARDSVMNFGEFISGRTVRAAVVVITILPIACIYPFFQKYFTKGILVGSLKG